jgi:hypothetical protein
MMLDHTPYATEAIKKVLGDDYCYDSTNTFRALYRNFTQCQFIEDEVCFAPFFHFFPPSFSWWSCC